MAGSKEELLRKVFFYRISHMSEVMDDLPGDIARIANLPWNEDGRYLFDGGDSRLALWPETVEYPIRLRFGKTRLGNLPVKEQAGKLEQLELAVDQGLVELCHISIYKEGYVAAEYNYSGPRMKRLSEYLYAKRNSLHEKITFQHLFQKDIIALVQNMADIKFLEIKGSLDSPALLRQADEGLGDAFDTLIQSGADKSIELGLSADSGKVSGLRQLAIKITEIARLNPGKTQAAMSKLRVRGLNSSGAIDAVDILEQHMVSFKVFAKESTDSKALSSEHAFSQLDKAYEERFDELELAAVGRDIFI